MVIRKILHSAVVKQTLLIVVCDDHFTVLMARFDELEKLLEPQLLYQTQFKFCFAESRMIQR